MIHQNDQIDVKMRGYTFQQVLRQNCVDFCLNTGKRVLLEVFLKNGARDFRNSPPFGRWACFYVTIIRNFDRFP